MKTLQLITDNYYTLKDELITSDFTIEGVTPEDLYHDVLIYVLFHEEVFKSITEFNNRIKHLYWSFSTRKRKECLTTNTDNNYEELHNH